MKKKESITTADPDKWDLIWEDQERKCREWDYLSEIVFYVLKEEVGKFKGKRIIEVGSGSGRISLRMAELSADITLLDYSTKALDISRNLFQKNSLEATFIQADILHSTLGDNRYDVVWNAGVLEHFPYDQQREIIKKLLRALKKDGMLITLNPYSRSSLYNMGKCFLVAFNRWAFGKEYPIRSIRDVYDDIGKNFDLKEYSVGFIVFFVDMYKFLPDNIQQLKVIKIVSRLFIRFADAISGLDKFLSRLFGGYLIVSIIKNK